MEEVKRIAIFGLPGSGKSTFAVKLGKIMDMPVHHLDKHMFIADGKKRNRQEFLSLWGQKLHDNVFDDGGEMG